MASRLPSRLAVRSGNLAVPPFVLAEDWSCTPMGLVIEVVLTVAAFVALCIFVEMRLPAKLLRHSSK